MKLGMYLYELRRTRFGIPVSMLIAVAAGLLAAYHVSLLPPGLHPRGLEMATASAQVVVDRPGTFLIQPEPTPELDDMIQRTLILGNIVGSPAVVQYIAQAAHIPASAIKMQTPTTPSQPEAIVTPENHPATTDVFRTNNEYRINVQANPTVPILSLYTEADTTAMAKLLANAAIAGLREYIQSAASSERVGLPQVRLDQLGGAEGGTVTGAANSQIAGVVFLLVFLVSSGLSVLVARASRGWKIAGKAAPARTTRRSRGTDAGSAEPSLKPKLTV